MHQSSRPSLHHHRHLHRRRSVAAAAAAHHAVDHDHAHAGQVAKLDAFQQGACGIVLGDMSDHTSGQPYKCLG